MAHMARIVSVVPKHLTWYLERWYQIVVPSSAGRTLVPHGTIGWRKMDPTDNVSLWLVDGMLLYLQASRILRICFTHVLHFDRRCDITRLDCTGMRKS